MNERDEQEREQPCDGCGCLPSAPEEWTDGEGPWRLYRCCACDCHEGSAGDEEEVSA